MNKYFNKYNDFENKNFICREHNLLISDNILYTLNGVYNISNVIYENHRISFSINEGIMSDAWDVTKKGVGYVLDAAWDTIKFPTEDISSFEGMMAWGHWFTSTTSLASMVIGLVFSIFTGGTSIFAGATAAKVVDLIDIGLYVIECSKYAIDGDYLKAAVPLVLGGISAFLLTTTPQGNSPIVKSLAKGLEKIKNKFNPSTLKEGVDFVLKQPDVELKLGKKIGNGFMELLKILDELLERLLPGLYQIGAFLVKKTGAMFKKLADFFIKIHKMISKGWQSLKNMFKSKTVDVVEKNLLSKNEIMAKILDADDLIKLGDKLTPKSRGKLINLFTSLSEKATKGGYNVNAQFFSNVKKLPVSIEQLEKFAKNIENIDDYLLDNLPNVFDNKPMDKFFGKICELSSDELTILCGKSKNQDFLKYLHSETDIIKIKNVVNNIKYFKDIKNIDEFKKISPELLDIFTKSGGEHYETLISPTFKKIGEESKAKILDILSNDIAKGTKVRFSPINLADIDMDFNTLIESMFKENGECVITFAGKHYKNYKAFEQAVKDGIVSNKAISNATSSINRFTRFLRKNTANESSKDFLDFLNMDKALTQDNTNTVVINKEQIGGDSSADTPIFNKDKYTEDQHQAIYKYIREIFQKTDVINKNKSEKFDETLHDTLIKQNPSDTYDFDFTKDENLVDCVKLMQTYLNKYAKPEELLVVDGKIGAKTLNVAFNYYNSTNTSGGKIGKVRAELTQELINKLK